MTIYSIALRSAIGCLAAAAAAPLAAQAPTPPTPEILACYRAKIDEGKPEGSGIVYRINAAGVAAQQGCASSRDIQFSWTTRHTALTGLDADDHKQYLLVSGARPLTGALSAGGFKITGLAAATAAADAVRFDQAIIKGVDPAGGDLAGKYPNPSVAKLQGKAVSGALPKNGDVLTFNATTNTWEPKPARNGNNDDDNNDIRMFPLRALERRTQEQAREIETLRAELAALRAEIAQRKP